jgi:hypothetical protein
MSRLILHIGLHRTGMRAVQDRLFLHRAALARAGILYPELGPNRAHHVLVAPWMDLPGLPEGYFSRDGREAPWQALRQAAAAPGHDCVILSAEAFSRATPAQVDMADLAGRLRIFDEVRVVVTLRHQAALLPALWLELARHQRPPLPASFIARALSDHVAAGVWLDFTRLHDRLLAGFPAGAITMLDLPQVAARPGGLFAALLDLARPGEGAALAAALSAPLSAAAAPDGPQGETPAGLPKLPNPTDLTDLTDPAGDHPLAMLAAQAVTAQPVPDPGTLALLSRAFGPPPGILPRSHLTTRAEQARLLATFAPLNAALVARLQQTQPGFCLTPPPDPENDQGDNQGPLFREDMTADLWAGIAAALFQDGPARATIEADPKGGLPGRIWRRILGMGPT